MHSGLQRHTSLVEEPTLLCIPEMIAILEFGHRGTGDEKVDHQNRPEFSQRIKDVPAIRLTND
jgi:hypothetical protein